MRLFIAGVTGVGKSYFARNLALKLGNSYKTISASKIIKDGLKGNSKYEILDRTSKEAQIHREKFLCDFLTKENDIILDGHFTVRYQGKLMTVYHEAFTPFFDLFIILDDSIENIIQRRKKRKGELDELDEERIAEEQNYEKEMANNFLSDVKSKLMIIDYGTPFNLIFRKITTVVDF